MKSGLTLIGIPLIALGLITLVYQGITYTTSERSWISVPSRSPPKKRRRSRCPRSLGASHWQAASS